MHGDQAGQDSHVPGVDHASRRRARKPTSKSRFTAWYPASLRSGILGIYVSSVKSVIYVISVISVLFVIFVDLLYLLYLLYWAYLL